VLCIAIPNAREDESFAAHARQFVAYTQWWLTLGKAR
jgi:hypothetical protein